MTDTAVRAAARTKRRRSVPCQRQEGGFAGASGLAVIQSAPSVDCVLALLVGFIGGTIAGLAVAHLRSSEDSGQGRDSPRFRPPPVPSDRSEGDTSPEAPTSIPAGTELTDEETVLRLLVSNGGRMKQSRIVERTGWSKAKVSRLLSSMEGRDEITKLTHGRENLIFLGTADEPNVDSPLDR